MNKIYFFLFLFFLAVPLHAQTKENLIICNEGNWQQDNGQLSYYDASAGTMTNGWFRKVNGTKLGDTPNDIIQVNDTLIAIAVNWSNIIQYIHPDGTACGATENVPNNRRMCSDGRYLYITSYAHKCTIGGKEVTFTKGYVAKIDVNSHEVVDTCQVGWEPEGIRLYNGKLYVANSGGYAFAESHDYEKTISVIDAATMTLEKNIDTGCINLYSEMSQAGPYILVNSCGDYYETAPKTVILNCDNDQVTTFDFPCTYNSTDGSKFYTIGSAFSYDTGDYTWYINTIDPTTMTVTAGIFNDAITSKIKTLQSPYELYISPYTGNVYFTDAVGYTDAGELYGYTQSGEQLFKPLQVYMCPAHILALPPAESTGINKVTTTSNANDAMYNLTGQRVGNDYHGVVIRGGKKYVK
ncbi:YncE family protein [Prevotella sp. AGR2160]|uniref:YncE family protein n=1 Tax=Prevotella sp. AGR2160 TaxID=1280674 RepID=UPI0003FFF4E0|nr:hypothetical protein [Prevotella sp. AGR2160]